MARNRPPEAPKTTSYLSALPVPEEAFGARRGADGLLRVPMPDPETLLELAPQFERAAREARGSLEPLREELLKNIRRTDPVILYGQLHVLDALRRLTHRGAHGFGSDAAVEFLGGLIAALPEEELAALTAPREQPWEDLQMVRDIDEVLQRFASADLTDLLATSAESTEKTAFGAARDQLVFERGFDRMAGYDPHLRAVLAELLAPLADASRAALGFGLPDVVLLADAHAARLQRHMSHAREQVVEWQRTAGQMMAPQERERYRVAEFAYLVSAGAFPATDRLPELLAADTGLSEEEVRAALDQLGTRIGGHPEPHRMSSANPLRQRPVMITPDGRYLWPRPQDFLHGVLDWLDVVCGPHDELLRLLNRTRERLCETMTNDVLTRIFGADRVWANPTYPADGQQPDIDVLVLLPDTAIVVEAKSARLTEAGRRGAPDRVRRKVAEFVEKAQAQNARTVAHITSAQPRLRFKKKSLDVETVTRVVPIVVTLERLDPLAVHLPGTRGGDEESVSWMVTLADLLMVADLLRTPEEFFAYAEMRVRLATSPDLSASIEADVLGLWLAKRLNLLSTPAEPAPAGLLSIGHQSDELNRYYNAVTVAASLARAHPDDPPLTIPCRPATGLPAEVLAALQVLMANADPAWAPMTIAALAVTPDQWAPVRSALTRVLRPGDSRRARRRARQAGSGIVMPSGLVVTVVLGEDQQPVVELRITRQARTGGSRR